MYCLRSNLQLPAMQTVYFISGLGADERIFSRLQLQGCAIKYIRWLEPEINESIAAYAARLAKQIVDEKPVIAGLSFGGMMAIEMAKIISCKKIILLSSIPTYRQLPYWMQLAGKLRLNKIFPLQSFAIFKPLEYYIMGVETAGDKSLAQEYINTISPQYLKWSIHHILHWHNEWQPPVLYHIHGSNDRVFPIKKVQPTYIVTGGGHFMVYNRAAAVSSLLQLVLDKQD
jgi:pimeloyl-ACP methyl ester carboxylesterase